MKCIFDCEFRGILYNVIVKLTRLSGKDLKTLTQLWLYFTLNILLYPSSTLVFPEDQKILARTNCENYRTKSYNYVKMLVRFLFQKFQMGEAEVTCVVQVRPSPIKKLGFTGKYTATLESFQTRPDQINVISGQTITQAWLYIVTYRIPQLFPTETFFNLLLL